MNGEIVMDQKKPRKKTGGRKPGSLNRKTIVGKSVSETLKNWLGFDDESVERTGRLDANGYRGRLALKAMWDDERTVDPRYLALAKFLFSYAYGLPGKATERKEHRDPLVFASTSGYVNWDPRHPAAAAMDARSKALNDAKDQELRMQALEAAKPDEMIIDVKKGDTEVDGETLESVNPDTFNPGGGKR